MLFTIATNIINPLRLLLLLLLLKAGRRGRNITEINK
jgi:hypothetical protein